ncbi:MAG: hypothetical protein MJZ20_13885, partial [Bacteroidaceae bacterium]|nr:hypothetical protein [Bacteroidaceae bacterium]
INEATTEDVINQNKESALAIIKLQKAKDDALAAIDDEMKGMTTLTDADIQLINVYKTTINEATTEDVINQNKESALAIIELQKAKDDALAAIDNEMDGETSSVYLNGLVQDNLNAINNSDDYEVINKNRDEAINKIKAVIDIYKAGASETLGTLATPQAGCVAVKVTKGDKEVILYAPDKVKVIKIPANK